MKDRGKQTRFRKILKVADTDVAHVLELIRDFLSDYPDHPGAQLQLGRTFVEMGRYDEARRVFKKVILRAPNDKLSWVYSHLGDLYAYKGDYGRAAPWYQKAIAQQPGEITFHIFLGATLAKAGKLDEALDAHRHAVRCRKGCRDEAYLNLGFVLRAKERYREASRCFKKALDIDPKYQEAREALFDVERALEQKMKRTTKRASE